VPMRVSSCDKWMLQCSLRTLVLRARSETIGYAYEIEEAVNSKHETRNPKQYRMTKTEMIESIRISHVMNPVLFLSFGHLLFEFVSYFDIRISDLGDATLANHALWA